MFIPINNHKFNNFNMPNEIYHVCFYPQAREQFSKSQTGVQVDGVSEMLSRLRMTSSDATKYSGDLLAVMEMLRNTSQVFKGAGYSVVDIEVKKHFKKSNHLSLGASETLLDLMPTKNCPFSLIRIMSRQSAIY